MEGEIEGERDAPSVFRGESGIARSGSASESKCVCDDTDGDEAEPSDRSST